MAIRTFQPIGGVLTIEKDPDSKLFYYGDISEWLADAGSPIEEVTATATGVAHTIVDFNGSILRAYVTGLDVSSEEAVNTLVWHVVLVDGQEEDFTIAFTKREN